MSWVDSHCHLHLFENATLESIQAYYEQARLAGVQHMLCVGTALEESDTIIKLVQQFPHLSGSIGLHPNTAVDEEPTIETLYDKLQAHPRLVAIGETGLDYYRLQDPYHQLQQQTRFRIHIEAARMTNKPLIVHTRAARADTIRMLTEAAPNIRGVIHCFTEDWPTAKALLDAGYYISFSGIVTFKNAEALREVVRQVPIDRLLIETDSPWLAPEPKRGHLNQPAYLPYVAECVAGLKGISLDALSLHTTRNFDELFPNARHG